MGYAIVRVSLERILNKSWFYLATLPRNAATMELP
jgi:hypothetical protein